jgi:hypothetical protein
VKNFASRLILEKWPYKSNGLTYQKNKKIGSRFLVAESLCKISALRVFSGAQNLTATLGL